MTAKKVYTGRWIMIQANSSIYGFNALVREDKAEGVLKAILKNYKYLDAKCHNNVEVTPLKVTTAVANPELWPR